MDVALEWIKDIHVIYFIDWQCGFSCLSTICGYICRGAMGEIWVWMLDVILFM